MNCFIIIIALRQNNCIVAFYLINSKETFNQQSDIQIVITVFVGIEFSKLLYFHQMRVKMRRLNLLSLEDILWIYHCKRLETNKYFRVYIQTRTYRGYIKMLWHTLGASFSHQSTPTNNSLSLPLSYTTWHGDAGVLNGV